MPSERRPAREKKKKVSPLKIEQEAAPFSFVALTEASSLHPDDNQDTKLELEKQGVFGVFDGLGGHANASRASQLAREKVREFLATAPVIDETVLEQAIQAAHEAIDAENKQRRYEDRIGTTASLIHVRRQDDDRIELYVAQSGDSPVFIVRPDGSLDEVIPHRWSADEEEQYKAELIGISTENLLSASPQARYYRQKRNTLSGFVGYQGGDCLVQTTRIVLEPGTRIMVMTDGISSNLLKNDIKEILTIVPDLKSVPRFLVTAARVRSHMNTLLAKIDDMTVIIVET